MLLLERQSNAMKQDWDSLRAFSIAAALCRSISGVLRSHGNKSIEKNLTASEYEARQSDCCRERHSQKHGPVPWFCWMLRSRCSATRFKKFHCFLLEVNLEHMEQCALTDWKCWTLEVGQFVSMATGPQLKVSKWKFHVHWYHWFINWAERCWKWNWVKILEMIRLYQQTPFSLKAECYFFLMKVVTFALHQRQFAHPSHPSFASLFASTVSVWISTLACCSAAHWRTWRTEVLSSKPPTGWTAAQLFAWGLFEQMQKLGSCHIATHASDWSKRWLVYILTLTRCLYLYITITYIFSNISSTQPNYLSTRLDLQDLEGRSELSAYTADKRRQEIMEPYRSMVLVRNCDANAICRLMVSIKTSKKYCDVRPWLSVLINFGFIFLWILWIIFVILYDRMSTCFLQDLLWHSDTLKGFGPSSVHLAFVAPRLIMKAVKCSRMSPGTSLVRRCLFFVTGHASNLQVTNT